MLNQLEISRFDNLTNHAQSYVNCMMIEKTSVTKIKKVSKNLNSTANLAPKPIAEVKDTEVHYDFVGVAG